MALLALGINHNTASVALREQLAFSPEQIESALLSAMETGLSEIAILSTCNRTEIYAQSQDECNQLLTWLSNYRNLSFDELNASHYVKTSESAISHMMRVASGLDSLVLGEPQILGQMKASYAHARESGTVGPVLHDAFQQVFAIAKRVRTETAIGENPVSVAYAAVSLAQQIFSDLKKDTALLIGAGETIELVARHLSEQGIKSIIVANRTLSRAATLADEFDGKGILLEEIPEVLPHVDIIISSTASPLPILGKGSVEAALKVRKHKPMFMVDIAVPRDIEEQVGDLPDVYLYTVDDLSDVIQENLRSRQEAAEQADEIIADGVKSYVSGLRVQDSVSTIRAYRKKAETLRDAELQKALKSLSSGGDPEKLMQQLARNLTNKLLHSPTAKLRQASAEGRADLIGWTQELFDLDQQDLT
ncbi:glutamyl-tRNA reductase [Sessilibacter corallicola]|uniref:glutamyl-tRNA reductase n=1 Tax=Sessilibacter corallicola TaxID=2904075 RepID=UPI001E540A50|nr:glutamyl-tRNA reductase [Sessilibacter corallicola]MCE2027173.1 glutamyl-tRNA reductase [Sessilibacter corallicola]